MQKKLFLWAISAALAGFLFGFDTVVISGAESTIQDLWSLSGSMHGLAISSALWGTVLGSVIGGIPTERFGRKKTLIFNGFLYLISALGSAYAWGLWSFVFFRFIGGVGIGIATIATPLFISEISPAKNRGQLTALFQFNIVFGILMAFLSNYIVGLLAPADTAWRWMLGIEAVPAFLYMVMCFPLPESPRWLIVSAKKVDAARKIFAEINHDMNDAELDELVKSVKDSAAADFAKKASKGSFFSKRLRYPILFAFLIAAFNQLSGINIILYFSPRLLGLAGIDNPLMAAVSLGIANLIFTFIGVKLIDKLGRRTLLLIGCCGYILSLAVCTFAFFHFHDLKVVSSAIDVTASSEQVIRIENNQGFMTDADKKAAFIKFDEAKQTLSETIASDQNYQQFNVSELNGTDTHAINAFAKEVKAQATSNLGSVSSLVLVCMILFIAAHAVGSGTIIWVFISEIFPTDQRASGQSLGSFTHWIFAAGLTLVFPIAIANFDAGYMFGFFCLMMILQLIWAVFMMPETKGRTLEDIAGSLESN